LTRPFIQVVTRVPTKAAIKTVTPDTNRAIEGESNDMNAAIPVAPAVKAGPK
jgi:hypothetical protein